MIINQLENGVTEYITDKAIVRIHPGKRTEEERRAALEKACQDFYRAVYNNPKTRYLLEEGGD